MRSLYCLFAMVMLYFPTLAVCSDDLILSRAVLEDPSGQLSIRQAARMDFHPIGMLLAKGYTHSAFWIRIQLQPPAKGREVVLRIRPTFLDDIRLYEPDPVRPGTWNVHISGDHYRSDQRDRVAVPFEFVVYPEKPFSTYYLRLKTTSSAMLYVQGLTPKGAYLKDERLDLFQIIFLSSMGWMLFLAVQDYFNSRDRIAAIFAAYQGMYIVYDLSVSGYLALLLPVDISQWADDITSISAMCMPFSAILFYRSLYQLYDSPGWLLKPFTALLLLLPVEIVMMIAGYVNRALAINALSVFPILLFLPLMAFTARRENIPSRRGLRIVSLLQSATLIAFLFPIMGWSGGHVQAELTLDATLIHGLLSALLMFGILHIRIQELIKGAQKMKLELNVARMKLQMQDNQYREQSNFMDMLTHELKTSMSAIRLILDLRHPSDKAREHAIQSIQDMDLLMERCLQSDCLEQDKWQMHFRPCRLESIWEDTQASSASPERFNVVSELLPELQSDPQILRIILGNLADNALKYSEPHTEIHIRMAASMLGQNKAVCFTIENLPGTSGLPDPEQVYSKYYRNPNARSKTGSGLGLYLVQGLTRRLGGEISYQHVAGKVKFSLWVPS